MKNKVLVLTFILVLSLLQVSPVLARDSGRGSRGFLENIRENVNGINREERLQSNNAQGEENNLVRAKQRVNAEITRRVNTLNTILQRIQNDNELTSDEKSNLSSDIQSYVGGLTGLKSKVEADTDIRTVRSDAKEVSSNFKVNEIAAPKTRILITIDNLQAVVTKIIKFTPEIQSLINNLSAEGKEVSQLQTLLNDVNNRLTAVNNQLTADRNLVLGVTASTTNPKSIFAQVRKDLTSDRQDLAQVRHDFAQMRKEFKFIITGGNSGNGSASVSSTPSPTPTP